MIAAIATHRLARHLLSRSRFRIPEDVVTWMGAVQAQEYGPAKWGLGLRLSHAAADADVERAFADGRILRTHVMRPTWHFVAADDIRWLQQLTAPRVRRTLAVYNRRYELDAATLARGTAVVERALRDRHYLTRPELAARLRDAGLSFSGIRLALFLMDTELESIVCSGPRRGKQFTYALVAERAPRALTLPRDEALAALTRRYFTSHGPATIRDFVWWSGLTTADAKRGLEMNDARREEIDGHAYFSVGPSPRSGARQPLAHLLPIYDEYLVAYRDRVAVPHRAATAARANGPVRFQHAIVVGGQVAGTWRIAPVRRAVAIDAIALRRLSARERTAIGEAADRYARFIGVPMQCSIRTARATV
ncbi:MAG TPA: winged helix DNA-binding domain-containing protein [Vicinamibacterales bacterium]|nr:winged helix DNA-binding domain-containing protein [Vicinamibacterales bacterium]